jgi:hypothetical protein
VNVNDLFRALSFGELSNLSMSNEGNGTITAAAQPKIIHHLNEGLLKLYSRFVLKEDDILVQLYDHITFYHLNPRFAVNYVPVGGSDDEDIRYLLDMPGEPFKGDIIKILTVYDSNGCKLPLNDDEQPLSLFTPQANLLQVPYPKNDMALSVMYQAKHDKIQGELEETIELPDILLEALTNFIAYKVYGSIGSDNSTAKSLAHYAAFESVCREVEDKDLVSTSISTSNARFHKRGWV